MSHLDHGKLDEAENPLKINKLLDSSRLVIVSRKIASPPRMDGWIDYGGRMICARSDCWPSLVYSRERRNKNSQFEQTI